MDVKEWAKEALSEEIETAEELTDRYSMYELLEAWLQYEGIFGYMTAIRRFFDACGIALYNTNTGEIQEAMDDFKY